MDYTPSHFITDLLDKAVHDQDRDVYVITISGEMYRHLQGIHPHWGPATEGSSLT